MKKISLILTAVAILSLASCSKDRTCSCTITKSTVTTGGSSSSTNSTESIKYSDSKKADVRDKCLSTVKTEVNGITTTTTKSDCTLSKE